MLIWISTLDKKMCANRRKYAGKQNMRTDGNTLEWAIWYIKNKRFLKNSENVVKQVLLKMNSPKRKMTHSLSETCANYENP